MSKVEEGSTPSGIDALLEDASVDDFPFTRSVVTLDGATNLEDAFRVLAKNSISSVPIKHEGTWVGFVDISDLVQHVAELYRTLQAAETARNFTSLKALLTEESRLMPKPVESCVNISKNNPFLPVAPGSSLKDVLLRLAKRQDGAQVHRVPVVDPKTGEITKIVSQSTAIRFLYTHIDALGSVADATLESLGLARKPVVTVKATDPCLKAFDLMSKHKLSGLAVTTASGGVLCSISAADVRFMVNIDKFDLVGMDVISFVSTCRQMDSTRMDKTMAPMVAVSPTTTIRNVVGKLAATHLHRLYVVDKTDLCGVVSLKDLLYALLVGTKPAAATAE